MTRPGVWRDEAHDFNDLLARVKRIELAMASSHVASLDAALPNTPSDGQDFYYSLPDGGQWHFRFNERTGLWDFAGGPPIIDEVGTDENRSSASYGDLATVGPVITIPFSGDYVVEFGCNIYGGSADTTAWMSFAVDSDAPLDDDGITVTSATTFDAYTASRKLTKNDLAAGTVLTAKYKPQTAVTFSFRYRWMSAKPITVRA